MLKKIIVFSAMFVVALSTLFYSKAHAAGSGTIYISPATATYHLNDTVSLSVRENSGATNVNGVSFVGAYNQSLLQFQSWDFTGSGFEVAATSNGGSGAIAADRGTTSGTLSGDQLIGKVNFKVLAPGTTTVSVDNSSVVLATSDNTDQVGTRTGSNLTLITGFENRVAHRANGQAFYFKVDKRFYIPNPAVRNCVMTRYGTGPDFLTSDAEIFGLFTDGGQTAHCPYETELGLNFVKESTSPTIWLVHADGSKQHVGSLCVSDPFTTVLKKFHVFTVPNGETWGHIEDPNVWWATGSLCAALPG
jgi:hypothetical protein